MSEPTIGVCTDDLARTLHELYRAKCQVTELQARMTKMVGERREHLHERVREFCSLVKVDMAERPTVPSDDVVRLRIRLVVEEMFELIRELFDDSLYQLNPIFGESLELLSARLDLYISNAPVRVNLAGVAREQADLKYVAQGLALVMGIDTRPVDAMVHAANMTKGAGPVRADGKRMKPPDFVAPDVEGEIRRQAMGGGE